MSGVEVTSVSGGSHGLAAAYAALRLLADAYDRAGDRMRGWADLGRRALLDGDLLDSALLAPLTFAEAEAAVLGAATGPDGALAAGLWWEADAVAVRTAVAALEGADELARSAFEVVDHAAGRAIGTLLLACLPVLLPLVPVAPLVAPVLEDRLADAVADHRGAVQHLVNGGGGLLDGLLLAGVLPGPWRPRDTEAAAAVLAAAYGDPGRGRAVALGPAAPTRQPGGLADLLRDLDRVHRTGTDGTIEVHTATAPDGSVRHVVHLPGTDDLATLPWTQDDDARDLVTNLLLVAGLDNPYQQGVLDAMAQAGIGAGDPVLLVGHSQGGMVAAAVLAQDGPFHVTDVVTAGSPTAHVDGFPPGSHVLSLEHRGDLVPLLEGEDNRDTVQQTTVRFGTAGVGGEGRADGSSAGLAAAHDVRHYTAAADALEAAVGDGTAHPSVVDALRRLEERGYVGGPPGTQVTSRSFRVVRE